MENESLLPLNLWMIRAQGDPQQAHEEEKQGQVCLGVNVDAVRLHDGFCADRVWQGLQRAAHGALAMLTAKTSQQPLGTKACNPQRLTNFPALF